MSRRRSQGCRGQEEELAIDQDLDRAGITRREAMQRGAVGLVGIGALGLAACGDDEDGATTAAKAAKRGGTLSVGLQGAGNLASFDPQFTPAATADSARWVNVYSRLVEFHAEKRAFEPGAAEEITPNRSADEWTIRLREGLEFHNGKPATADDLMFTIRRAASKKSLWALNWSTAKLNEMKKLDERTVRVPLAQPNAVFDQTTAAFHSGTFLPEGFDPAKPVGTGPFSFVSFKPGELTVLAKFRNYRLGEPAFVDQVRILEYEDDSARANALLAGQVDAIDNLPTAQIPVVKGREELEVLINESGVWHTITMHSKAAPFNDVKVRQAFRLIADRDQIIESAYGGQGTVGNDVFGLADPDYSGDKLPQREQDIEQARSLLSQAGQSDLRVKLTTSPIAAGMVEMCTVFAQQAKDAGVTVAIDKVSSSAFFGSQWLKYPFAISYWTPVTYWSTAAQALAPGCPYPETHFDNAAWTKLWNQAHRELDADRRKEIVAEMQKLEWEDGGYIIPVFINWVSAVSKKTSGWSTGQSQFALGNYSFANVSVE